MTNLTPEMVEKARNAKSEEDLLALAKENGVEMTAEEAKVYFEQLNVKSGELSDDELDNVAGGGCHSGDGRLVVTIEYCCEHWACTCGHTKTRLYGIGQSSFYGCSCCGKKAECKHCKYMSYERGLWLCNHPTNKR